MLFWDLVTSPISGEYTVRCRPICHAHRNLNAFGAFAAAYGDALWWGMVVSYLLTLLKRSVIYSNCFSATFFIWVSMRVFF